MFNVNTSTKKITNNKSYFVQDIKAVQKLTFALYDNAGQAIFSQGKNFRLTIADFWSNYTITAIDDNFVSFRNLIFSQKLTSSPSTKTVKIEQLVNGNWVQILNDSITFTADIGGGGSGGTGVTSYNDLTDKPDLTVYVTSSAIASAGYLTSNALSDYVTSTALDSKGYITQTALSDYVTSSAIDSKFAEIDALLDYINGEII